MLKACYACHTLHPVGQRCPRAQPWGGRRWVKQRERILERDGHTCQECGAPAEHVDHIVTRAMGGSDDDSNLQALCAKHNLAKGNA